MHIIMDYIFLQYYWWFLISLLGALLIFLLFVQGGNALLFIIGKTEEERTLLINTTGRKWEFTFTTLVVFGGAFFASFPLFYSTSFGGAYWLWMIILFSFVLQAVSYEFQSKIGNLLGKKTYQIFLVINGYIGPILLGTAVGTFFNGANFVINKGNITNELMPVISHWGNASNGLDILLNPWNILLGLVIFFLARVLGLLYYINRISEPTIIDRCRKRLWLEAIVFVVLFLGFVAYLFLKEGYAIMPITNIIYIEPYKYFLNFVQQPILLIILIVGVFLVLFGILRTLLSATSYKGIWFAGL